MGTRYIHLVPHGQYHMEEKHPKYGSLTAIGRHQGKCVAKRLNDHKITSVHISTMTRAKETAQIILETLSVKRRLNSKLLVEGIPRFPTKLMREKKLKKSQLNKTKLRMNRSFKKYFKPFKGKGEKHEALICHGNIIRYLVAKALGIDTSKWLSFEIYQCSISTVSIDQDGTMRLVAFGEVGHIALAKRTFI